MVPATAEGVTVFCVDIADLAADLGVGKGSDAYEALGSSATAADKMALVKDAGSEISDVVITTTNSDGTETNIAVDESKLYYGDIEGNGKLRLEIYNAYGDTSKDAPIDPASVVFDDSMSVTFTITGIGGSDDVATDATESTTDAETTTPDKGSPDTGVEGIAAVAGVAVLAAGAVIVSKKRS